MALTAQHSTAFRRLAENQADLAVPIFEQALGNNHYEGDVKSNKTLQIVIPGTPSTTTYTGADFTFSTPATTSDTFTCDQKSYYAYQVTHDTQQGSIFDILQIYAQKGAQAMALDVDAYVASLHSSITTNVHGNSTTPIVVGLDTQGGEMLPSRALSRLTRLITDSKGDTSNLQVVIPPWLADALLIEVGAKLTQRGDQTSQYGVTVGKMGIVVGGFNGIYVSTNVANTASDKYKIMAGTPDSSITIARAISEASTGERELNFAKYVKALLVYGAKIPLEKNMALGTYTPGTDGNGNSLL